MLLEILIDVKYFTFFFYINVGKKYFRDYRSLVSKKNLTTMFYLSCKNCQKIKSPFIIVLPITVEHLYYSIENQVF